MEKERTRCQIFSRIVGYLRPINDWNEGKKAEYNDRKNYILTEPDFEY